MATQVEQLMNRLRNDTFRENFLQNCEEVTRRAGGFYNEPPGKEYEDLRDNWRASLEFAMVGEMWLPEILDKAIASLSKPPVILPRELWGEFEVYLDEECYGISPETYDAYLDHIEHRFLKLRRSEPFELCTLSFPESTKNIGYMIYGALVTQAKILGNVSEADIKKSAEALIDNDEDLPPAVIGRIGEFEILFEGVKFSATERNLRKPDPDAVSYGRLQVEISARSSARAMDALVMALAPLAQSHFRSVALLESGLNVDNFKKYLPFGISGLEMAILNASSKDTFERRIGNAVHLLAAADAQQNDSIGLSLSVTAIEALLGRKDSEMAHKLTEFVAVLLEPDLDHRYDAMKYVKDIYDKRSRVLHGENLEDNESLRDGARRLAASILYAIWEYRSFFRRFDEKDAKPEELFEKLRKGLFQSGGPVVGLELPVRSLWQKSPNAQAQ